MTQVDNVADVAEVTADVNTVLLNQAVATLDGSANTLERDATGNRSDDHSTSTIAGRVHALAEHAHSIQFVAPDLDDAVSVTADAAAWTLSAAFVEVIAANEINTAFDLHFVSLAFGANDEYQLNVYAGEVLIAGVDGERNTNQTRLGDAPVQMPIQPANTQIQVKLACKSTNANSATVKFKGHRY